MNLHKSSLVRHIGLEVIRIDEPDPFGILPMDVCITSSGDLRFSWEAWNGASGYNFYQEIEGEWIQISLTTIPEPLYEIPPEEFGDGTHKVGVEPIVNGQGIGIQYELVFGLDFELTHTIDLQASSGAVIEEGDTLLVAYHYNAQQVESRIGLESLQGSYNYDFNDYVVDRVPFGWYWFWDKGNVVDWQIREENGVHFIGFSRAFGVRRALCAVELGELKDVRLLCDVSVETISNNLQRIHLRTNENLDRSEGSIFISLNSNNTVYIGSYDDEGVFTNWEEIPYTRQADTWYRVRAKIIDNFVEAKIWQVGDSEPTDWMLSAQITDPYSEKGFVGVGNVISSSMLQRFKDFKAENLTGVIVPETPSNFQATLDGNDVSFTWDAVAGVDGYNLYKRAGVEFEKVNSSLITGTSFGVANLDDGAYEYHVKSVLSGIESYPNSDTFGIGSFYTDFSEYETGALPSDWSIVAGGGTWTVEEKTGVEGGKSLRFTGQTSGQHFLRWDSLPVLGDMRVEGKFMAETKGGNTRLRLLSRLGSNETAYFPELTGFSGNDRALWKVVNGSFTNLGNDGSSGYFSAGIWYQMKIECVGTTIRCKFWEDGESEPETWLFSVTDSSIDSGRAGASMRVNSASDLHWMDWIKVSFI